MLFSSPKKPSNTIILNARTILIEPFNSFYSEDVSKESFLPAFILEVPFQHCSCKVGCQLVRNPGFSLFVTFVYFVIYKFR